MATHRPFWTCAPAEAAADDQEDAARWRDELLEAGRDDRCAGRAHRRTRGGAQRQAGSRPRPAASAATPEKYIEIFHELDEDDGGTLDVEEVFKGLKKAGHKVTQKQAAQLTPPRTRRPPSLTWSSSLRS